MLIFMQQSDLMIIVYVENQNLSRDFYSKLLEIQPVLDVVGMTEFELNTNTRLGLMPKENISKILDFQVDIPDTKINKPSCELYFFVGNPDEYLQKLVLLGGKLLSAGKLRNWGHFVAYGFDLDNNLIAFAKKT